MTCKVNEKGKIRGGTDNSCCSNCLAGKPNKT